MARDGVWGMSDPMHNDGEVEPADIALGYANEPDPETDDAPEEHQDSQDKPEAAPEGNQTQDDQAPPQNDPEDATEPEDGADDGSSDSNDGGDKPSQDPAESAAPAEWEQEKAQMQQAIDQYEGVIGQLLQMMQTNPNAQLQGGPFPAQTMQPLQPGQLPPSGTPGQFNPQAGFHTPPGISQFPMAQQQMPQGAQPQPAATPAAPEASDEELQERFWSDPVSATRELITREAARMVQESVLPMIEQREAYFGQQLGQSILAPMAQTVAQVQQEIAWRDQMTNAYNELQSKEDADAVLPELRKMIQDNPALVAQLRSGQTQLAQLYDQAKARVDQAKKPAPGKKAAQMPRAAAPRVPGAPDNDTLLDEALGPSTSRGVWG